MTSFQVELEIFESVTRGGVRRVTWHVAQQGDWVSATAWPGAQVENQKNERGTVWLCRVVVPLTLGAELMRVESEPDRQKCADPLAYFFEAPRARRRLVRRSYFRVGSGGRLLRLPQPPGAKKPRT